MNPTLLSPPTPRSLSRGSMAWHAAPRAQRGWLARWPQWRHSNPFPHAAPKPTQKPLSAAPEYRPSAQSIPVSAGQTLTQVKTQRPTTPPLIVYDSGNSILAPDSFAEDNRSLALLAPRRQPSNSRPPAPRKADSQIQRRAKRVRCNVELSTGGTDGGGTNECPAAIRSASDFSGLHKSNAVHSETWRRGLLEWLVLHRRFRHSTFSSPRSSSGVQINGRNNPTCSR